MYMLSKIVPLCSWCFGLTALKFVLFMSYKIQSEINNNYMNMFSIDCSVVMLLLLFFPITEMYSFLLVQVFEGCKEALVQGRQT